MCGYLELYPRRDVPHAAEVFIFYRCASAELIATAPFCMVDGNSNISEREERVMYSLRAFQRRNVACPSLRLLHVVDPLLDGRGRTFPSTVGAARGFVVADAVAHAAGP